MSLAIRSAVRTHRGLVRGHNEDSAYAGRHLLAVADGVGGAVAGELASATVIGAIAPLDAQPPEDVESALRDAITLANRRLREAVRREPSLSGMGTTLTALLLADDRLGMAHIADSRAYRLRDGGLEQITRDETLVQTLIDEGRLSPAEARRHPYRSVILRSLTGEEVEPVLATSSPRPGDRYLLCSDGLTDYAELSSITAALELAAPGEVAERLIDLALAGGGGDNVTCIVADVIDGEPDDSAPAIVGAAADTEPATEISGRRPRLRRVTRREPGRPAQPPADPASPPTAEPDPAEPHPAEPDPDPAESQPADVHSAHDRHRAGVTQTAIPAYQDDPDSDPALAHTVSPPRRQRRRRRRRKLTAIGFAVLIVVVAAGYGGWRWTQTQYFVAAKGSGPVTLYKGVDMHVAGISFYHAVRRSGFVLDDLVPAARADVRHGITADSRDKAVTVYISIISGQLLPTCTPSPRPNATRRGGSASPAAPSAPAASSPSGAPRPATPSGSTPASSTRDCR
ncbi:MAG: protein phosphatase 2C domain-containing protein [Mycobacteriales bacterium]